MATRLFPGNVVNHIDSFKGEYVHVVGGRYTSLTGVAYIDTTLNTVWDVNFLSKQKGVANTVGLTVPIGATIYKVGFRVPALETGQTVTATAGNRLKVATAVGATGAQAFDALAATAYAASTVFTANAMTVEAPSFSISPYKGSATPTAADFSQPLTAAATFKLFNDNGTTAAGSGVRASTGTIPIVVQVCYWTDDTVPTFERIGGRFQSVA